MSACPKSHLVLSAQAGTGLGSDHPYLEPLVLDAWARVPNRSFKVAADAGFDSEAGHQILRQDMGLTSLIPPDQGGHRLLLLPDLLRRAPARRELQGSDFHRQRVLPAFDVVPEKLEVLVRAATADGFWVRCISSVRR